MVLPSDNVILSRELCERHATSFYLASQFLPEGKRADAYALYGFCRYADNLLDGVKSLDEKKKEFEELREELKNAWNGINGKNQIVESFVWASKKNNLSSEWGFYLLDGLKMDLEKTRYATFDDLYYYCYHVASVPGILMAHLGSVPTHVYPAAEALGIGMQLTNMIRDIKEDGKMGRIYFPLEEIKTFNLTEAHFLNGVMDDDMNAFLKYQVARARKYYDEAERGLSYLSTETRLALSLCFSFYKEILAQIEKKNYDVFTERIVVSHARKLELLQKEMAFNPLPTTPSLQ